MSRKRELNLNEADVKRAKIEEEASAQWTLPLQINDQGSQKRFERVDDNSRGDNSLPGRRSFRGFNVVVERNYAKLTGNLPAIDPATITIDEEAMAARYETLIGLPRGPNQVLLDIKFIR